MRPLTPTSVKHLACEKQEVSSLARTSVVPPDSEMVHRKYVNYLFDPVWFPVSGTK